MRSPSLPPIAPLSVALVQLVATWAGAAGEWQMADAPLRFKLSLERKPTHASAGYYVSLPDGGLLRGSLPAPTVLTEDGKTLASYLLWQNTENGFSLVFAKPEDESKPVYVYLRPSGSARVWNANTGLTPSPVLGTFSGRDNLAAAQGMAALGRVDASVHWGLNFGHPWSPFSIAGDRSGRPKPGAFYQLSYLDAPVAGDYWIAPFFHTAQAELLVDGVKVNAKERSKTWEGTGETFKLTKGLHRVEVLQAAPGSGPYSTEMNDRGLMYLVWQGPREAGKGGKPLELKEQYIVRSGGCKLEAVEAQNGSPQPAARIKRGHVYWFGNETPLLIFEFSAIDTGYPSDTKVSWTFPEGATIEGASVKWLVPGFREGKVKMTVRSGQSVSSCMVPYYGFGTQKTSLEQAEHRAAFRDTLANMLAVFPRNPNPISSWENTWWNNIFRTVEGGEGENLLSRLFNEHFEAVQKRLTTAQMATLEDVFLDVTLRDHPKENFTWLKKFFLTAPDQERKNDLLFREGELHMYYLNDRKRSENIYTTLASVRGEIGERSKIRLGDLALLSGDLNKATSFYADVQNRARTARNNGPAPLGASVTKQLLSGGATPPPIAASTKAPPDLKGGALQEVSLSENVRTLIAGGFFLEAKQALEAWETEFPLSKISGDYILREAAIHMGVRDWARARPMLEAYCREIDASSYLPEAASSLIKCVQSSKADPRSIHDVIGKVKDRLKFHPVAAELERFLSSTGAAPK